MIYASVCDGIGAAHVAWQPLGWRCAWTSEIEPFPIAVVDHHWGFPNLGDMTRITDDDLARNGPVDLLVGGTPCQSFSVAGLRKGLADPRGNLALVYLGLVDRLRPRWVVWENVPGVLLSGRGRDFGAFLGALGQLGYGFSYRVLDAGHFGCRVPRPRVFVVGHRGDWRPAAATLFDPASVSGDCGVCDARRTETGSPPVFVARGGMAHDCRACYILEDKGVRTSTPLEWERAMGFSDGYTDIQFNGKPATDTNRYESIGRSMGVPVVAWIGQRITEADHA